jgi:hypothetical protein
LDQIEVLMAVPVRDDPAEIGVSLAVSDQQDRPMVISRKFTSPNGLDTHFFGCLEKENESVQCIGVGQGEPIHPLRLGGAAELFNGGNTPTFGVMRMDIEMDKISHYSHHRGAESTENF